MRKTYFWGVICVVILLLSGCGKQDDVVYSESSVVSESTEYVLDDFNEETAQKFSNNGISLLLPEIWQMSIDEQDNMKTYQFDFEYGMMHILIEYSEDETIDYSDDESNLEYYTEAYKEAIMNDLTTSLTDSRQEIYHNKKMSVLDWNDVVNGNKIHGTTYLFVNQHWFYTISLVTYEEVSYQQELLNIMNTFEFNEIVSEGIPAHITELFNHYASIISSGNYAIRLGEKVGVDDSEEDYTYYRISLCPTDPDAVIYPAVSFYSDNEYTSKSFTIDALEHQSNSVVKDIILCTLIATNPDMTMDAVSELKAELINSYDGNRQSKVVETELYKYFITTEPHFNSMSFEVVAKEEINVPVEKELYSEYSINEMQAELNVGEKAFVKGIVVYEEYDWIFNTLHITDNDRKYHVHYTPESFPGEFCEGNEYVFYGTIKTECDSESGCLILDYYEVVEDVHNENNDIDNNDFSDIDESSKINVTFVKDYVDGAL